jgi:hypothetical protein
MITEIAFHACNRSKRPPICWPYSSNLLRIEDEMLRQWYKKEAAKQDWNTRVLERQEEKKNAP